MYAQIKPKKRMLEISRNMEDLQKTPVVPMVMSITLDLLSLMPVWILRSFYNRFRMTLGMTSFPGPEDQFLVMDSTRLVDIIPHSWVTRRAN